MHIGDRHMRYSCESFLKSVWLLLPDWSCGPLSNNMGVDSVYTAKLMCTIALSRERLYFLAGEAIFKTDGKEIDFSAKVE